MKRRRPFLLTALFGVMAAMVLANGFGVESAGAQEPSGCVACHTDETTLKRNLSAEKPKASALTAGAG